ncbi:MAG: ATP-binding protein [Acidobacteria bacterium]|nr:ATP-binding protein [Acidobacteriota bacterium]
MPIIPRWLEEQVIEIYNSSASHVFLLNGNVKDSFVGMGGAMPLEEGLQRLGQQRPVVFSYSLSTGFAFPSKEREMVFRRAAAIDGRSALPRQPQVALPLIERVFRNPKTPPRGVLALLPYLEDIAPAGGGANQSQEERSTVTSIVRWADDSQIAGKALILMLTENLADVADTLRTSQSGIHVVDVPRPDAVIRAAFIERFMASRQKELHRSVVELLADKTRGLTLRQVEDILLREPDLEESSLAAITSKKMEILTKEYGDVLEIIESRFGLDAVGGLDYAVRELSDIADLMRRGVTSAVPMGIMLMGPPGTGKSYLAECFAKECGLLCVKFKPLRQMYVGASERNQERAFNAIRSLAPVIVLVDESDQQEQARGSGPSGDSGTTERMRGQAFQFWGDQSLRGRILRIDITNRVDLIDAAMRRSGRTDVKVPILMPGLSARNQILGVIVKKHRFLTELKDFSEIAARTDSFAGSDLELLATTAFRFANQENSTVITTAHWHKALDDFIPSSRDEAAIDRMTLLALDECRSRRLLPPGADQLRDEIVRRLGAGQS